MRRVTPLGAVAAVIVVLGLLASASPVSAAPILDVTVTGGAPYLYEYDITNDIGELLIVTIAVPIGDPDIGPSVTAPLGFLTNYDAGLGLVDFLADTGAFLPGVPVSGFSFLSAFGPGPTIFEGLYGDGSIVAGRTIGPVAAPVAVPEPVTGLLLMLGLAAAERRRRSRRPRT